MKVRIAMALLAAFTTLAMADDRAEYNRRAAAADETAFRQLDLNGDGKLAKDEVRSDVNFGPRFDAADINRDEVVTADEMRRYLEQTYGVTGAPNGILVKQ
jgi:EF hand domain-containing protein